METKWYTIKSQSNREKTLSEKIKSEMLRKEIQGDVFVPTERVYFAKNGKKLYREKVLYPGYIFVETDSLHSLQDVLKAIPGNSGILKTKEGDPSYMKTEEIDKIKNDVDKINSYIDLYNYIIGENVKIIGGPFDKFVGIIEEIDKIKNKVKLNVLIFGRTTPVDLQLDQIEKILK